MSAYRERFPGQPPLPVAERAGDEVLSLPLSPAHSREDIDDAIAALRRVHAGFTARDRSFIARRPVRVIGGVVVTGLCIAYILWQIDVGQTLHVLRNAKLEYFFAAIAIMAGSVWPMAWRWKQLLKARGIHEDLLWLVRAYFTSYTVGQVLPTSIGGDGWRMYETTKRHPGYGGPIAGRCCSSACSAASRR